MAREDVADAVHRHLAGLKKMAGTTAHKDVTLTTVCHDAMGSPIFEIHMKAEYAVPVIFVTIDAARKVG
jgi:hypothetical protein